MGSGEVGFTSKISGLLFLGGPNGDKEEEIGDEWDWGGGFGVQGCSNKYGVGGRE